MDKQLSAAKQKLSAPAPKPCDIIQLGNAEGFYHSLFVVGVIDGIIYVSAHTNDTYFTPLESYYYESARCIHIKGARKWH